MATGLDSREALLEESADSLRENATYFLITQAIAEDAGLTADDAAMTAYFEKNMGSTDYSTFADSYGEPYLRFTVLNSLVLEHLRSHTKNT